PGTGKTLLASRLPSILPPLSTQETLEVASIYSISNTPHTFGQRPFRAPHHTASAIALVGGGCQFHK
ncbi:ATPase, partial [Acinetobacter baumannii]